VALRASAPAAQFRAVASAASKRLLERLANALRYERGERGWTQEETAERARMHLRHYQKLEEGSVNATLQTLERLCAAFGVDVRRLFEPH
jgi:transcriptional regulator with XRE-family HTH domain